MITPWLTICTSAPSMPSRLPAKIPRPMKPRWLIEAYATSRLRSVWTSAMKAP